MKVHYIYFKTHKVSFHYVAKKYIEQLQNAGIEVIEHDRYLHLVNAKGKLAILHPALHIALGSPAPAFPKIIRNFEHLIAIDVCDTDHLTPLSAWVLSNHDYVFASCEFCKKVFLASGVQSDVDVLWHGVDEYFFREPREPKSEEIKFIRDLKGFRILYFLWHDSFRKGADVVAEAIAKLQKKYDNIYVIVKLSEVFDPLFHLLFYLKNVYILRAWLDVDELIDLYDSVDLVLVPSRSGGFELNALEALARRKPVIVSEHGAFDDYCITCLRVKSRGRVRIYEHSPIISLMHDGMGVNPDPNDLAQKIEYVMNNYDEVLKIYQKTFDYVRENFTWKKVSEKLIKKVKEYL